MEKDRRSNPGYVIPEVLHCPVAAHLSAAMHIYPEAQRCTLRQGEAEEDYETPEEKKARMAILLEDKKKYMGDTMVPAERLRFNMPVRSMPASVPAGGKCHP